MLNSRPDLRRHPAFPVVVLVSSVLVNLIATFIVARAVRAREQIAFDAAVNAAAERVYSQFESFIVMVNGIASVYPKSGLREAADLDFARLRIERWPADVPPPIVGISVVTPNEILTKGAQLARDRGHTVLSATEKPGEFVLYSPVYSRPGEDKKERRERFSGVVHATFNAAEMFTAIFGRAPDPTLAIEIYDGDAPVPTKMLVDRAGQMEIEDARWHATRTLEIADRQWTMRFFAVSMFGLPLERSIPAALGFAGALVSFVLFAFARSQLQARRAAEDSNEARALALVQEKAARATAEDTSAVLDSFFRATPAGLAVLDRQLRYVRVNQSLADMNGRSIGDHIGRKISDVVRPEQAVAAQRALDTGEPTTIEVSSDAHRLVDSRTWLVNFGPVRTQSDETVGVAAVVIDITARKEEREALAALNHLGKSLAAELDPETIMQTVAEEATRLSGAATHAYVYITGDERTPPNKALQRATVQRIEDLRGDWPEIALPGTTVSYMSVPIVARSGEVLGALAFGSERPGAFNERAEKLVVGLAAQAAIAMDNARLFQEAQRLIRALERSNEDLDQFAYVASHDLKAPLRGIASVCDWIEEDLGKTIGDETKRHLHLLRGRIKRLEALIEGMLRFARASREDDEREDVEVRRLIEEVVALLAPPPGAKIAITSPLPQLKTSKVLLQQVFLNLIGNAMKYGGASADISARELPKMWEFTVRDSGPGIAPEFHEKIWGIFQTLQPRDKVEGTGIGLSVVRKIVLNRGGNAWVESKAGAGATFRFTWPK